MRTLIPTLLILLSACASARAALYEFTLGGRVTYALFGDVPIGSRVTIRYTVDSQDLEPDPTGGLYAASQATIKFPDFTITTNGMEGPSFGVGLGTSAQFVQYLTWRNGWGMSIPFAFPVGTLDTDALPLTLPLSEANVARFYVFPMLHDHYAGDITSYSAVEIPEPSAALLLLVTTLTVRGRARMSRERR